MLNASNLACNSGAYTTTRTVAFICWHSILLPCFPVFQEADGISSATHPSLNYVCSRATTAKERHPTTRLPYQNSNRSQYICNKRKRAVCKVSSDCEVRKQFGRSKSSFFYPWLEKLNVNLGSRSRGAFFTLESATVLMQKIAIQCGCVGACWFAINSSGVENVHLSLPSFRKALRRKKGNYLSL